MYNRIYLIQFIEVCQLDLHQIPLQCPHILLFKKDHSQYILAVTLMASPWLVIFYSCWVQKIAYWNLKVNYFSCCHKIWKSIWIHSCKANMNKQTNELIFEAIKRETSTINIICQSPFQLSLIKSSRRKWGSSNKIRDLLFQMVREEKKGEKKCDPIKTLYISNSGKIFHCLPTCKSCNRLCFVVEKAQIHPRTARK